MLTIGGNWCCARHSGAVQNGGFIAQGVYGGCASVITHTFHTNRRLLSMAMRKFLADKLLSLANAIEQDTSKEKLQAAVIVGRRKLADWIKPELPAAS